MGGFSIFLFQPQNGVVGAQRQGWMLSLLQSPPHTRSLLSRVYLQRFSGPDTGILGEGGSIRQDTSLLTQDLQGGWERP